MLSLPRYRSDKQPQAQMKSMILFEIRIKHVRDGNATVTDVFTFANPRTTYREEDMKLSFKDKPRLGALLSGACAGLVNGLFGAGGGMVLLPLLSRCTDLKPHEVFANCVCVILPLSVISIIVYSLRGGGLLFVESLPYLVGGAAGGVIAGLLLKRLPTKWLHRALGLVILWGGLRLLLR